MEVWYPRAMKPRRYGLRLATLCIVAAVMGVALAQGSSSQSGSSGKGQCTTSPPVETCVEIYVVNQTGQSGSGANEKLVKATTAFPGQTVEYRFFVKNIGQTTLPAGIVVLPVPVPKGMQYVPNSATPSSDKVLTEFSADGGTTYSKPPVLVGSGSSRKVAEPTSYTDVRWTVLQSLDPGQDLPFFFRVKVLKQ